MLAFGQHNLSLCGDQRPPNKHSVSIYLYDIRKKIECMKFKPLVKIKLGSEPYFHHASVEL